MSDMKLPISLTLIVAATTSNAIGRSSSLPWRLPKEMAYFARVTKGEVSDTIEKGKKNVVIMGRKSWEGIPNKFRPLNERINVVVSRQEDYDLSDSPDTHLASSLDESLNLTTSLPDSTTHRIFLIGGAQLYQHGLEAPSPLYKTDRILLTRIKTEFENCDAFFPEIDESKGWKRSSQDEFNKWTGFEVPAGDQKEKDRNSGGEVEYEFQMWTR